jgi:hypothetical protein
VPPLLDLASIPRKGDTKYRVGSYVHQLLCQTFRLGHVFRICGDLLARWAEFLAHFHAVEPTNLLVFQSGLGGCWNWIGCTGWCGGLEWGVFALHTTAQHCACGWDIGTHTTKPPIGTTLARVDTSPDTEDAAVVAVMANMDTPFFLSFLVLVATIARTGQHRGRAASGRMLDRCKRCAKLHCHRYDARIKPTPNPPRRR